MSRPTFTLGNGGPGLVTIDTVIRERKATAAAEAKRQTKAEQGRKKAARAATLGELLSPWFGDNDGHKAAAAPADSSVHQQGGQR